MNKAKQTMLQQVRDHDGKWQLTASDMLGITGSMWSYLEELRDEGLITIEQWGSGREITLTEKGKEKS